ncbi:MAG: Flp pilus assembly protein CpaB [Rhodobacterales bacterium]|nr:Flp pilus assembly protein CpaB [Rhodobacterales bacterium]
MARRQTGGRLRAFAFLAVSFIAAGIAAGLIYGVVQSYSQELTDVTRKEETAQVMVAAKSLPQGRTITDEDLILKELPPDYVPNAVLREKTEAIGRVPRERILLDEFIREERLADPEAGIGLNAIIPRGMRAISINILGGSAVSGFLNPGNYVDVLVTVLGDENHDAQTNTLLQAVTVLAVDARMSTGSAEAKGKQKPSVTLAVTPDQAEQITHAMSQSTIALTLRNDIDVTEVETHGAMVKNLLGGEDEEKRIPITQWKAKTSQSQDGSLLIIKGSAESREKVK